MAQQPKAEPLPVLSYATGAGWTVLGTARSPSAAARTIRQHISDASRSLVEKYGFQIVVSRRTALQRELNGGPDGFVWSIGKTIKTSTQS